MRGFSAKLGLEAGPLDRTARGEHRWRVPKRRVHGSLWRHLMVALGCLHLLGGPVVIVQCVGWAGMLVRYSAEDGLVQGVTDTFSGERPCPMCRIAREMERQTDEPALPAGENARRLAEALAQSMRTPERLEAPASRMMGAAFARTHVRDALRPEHPAMDPESPPPRAAA